MALRTVLQLLYRGGTVWCVHRRTTPVGVLGQHKNPLWLEKWTCHPIWNAGSARQEECVWAGLSKVSWSEQSIMQYLHAIMAPWLAGQWHHRPRGLQCTASIYECSRAAEGSMHACVTCHVCSKKDPITNKAWATLLVLKSLQPSPAGRWAAKRYQPPKLLVAGHPHCMN